MILWASLYYCYYYFYNYYYTVAAKSPGVRNINCFSSILTVIKLKFWISKENNHGNLLVLTEFSKILFWRFSLKFLRLFQTHQIKMHKRKDEWGENESNNKHRISKEPYFRNYLKRIVSTKLFKILRFRIPRRIPTFIRNHSGTYQLFYTKF